MLNGRPATPRPPEQVPDFMELVALVAGVSNRPELLVAAHVPDDARRCRGCYSTVLGAPTWPCLLAMIGKTITAQHCGTRAG